MAYPSAGAFVLGLTGTTGAAYLNDWLAASKQVAGAQDAVELTISSGSVTATVASHTIDTESDASSDDLTNIVASTFVGTLLFVGPETASRVVTLKHESGGAGQLSLAYGADVVLDATTKRVLFELDNGSSPVTWREVARFGFDAPGAVEHSTAGSGSPNILTAGETGKALTNKGSSAKNYHTLPSARAGLSFVFVCEDSDGIRIVADSGDTIRIAASVTPAAGYVECATVGNVVTLHAIDDTQWIAVSYVGAWTVST